MKSLFIPLTHNLMRWKSLSNIDKLVALLKTDEDGEEISGWLSEFLVDARKRDILFIKINELWREMYTLGQEVKLSKSEEILRSIVLRVKKPLTVQEVTAKVDSSFRSLKHTSHASSVLNTLVSKGALGRFKLGYNYYYTSPKEAVNEQLKQRGEMPGECSPAKIAADTGMPLPVVLDAIEELKV